MPENSSHVNYFPEQFFPLVFLVFYYGLISFLTLYSLHRFWIIFLYIKYYKRSPPRRIQLSNASRNLPFVTVQIPVYNEVYVVKRVLHAVENLSYPKNKLEIQILDDSTDETSEIIKDEVKRIQKKGKQILHHRRKERSNFKAGALKEGLKLAQGEIVAIFDADFLPDRDFLLKTVGYLQDPKVGVVQTRWAYINAKSSILTKSQYLTLDAHFQLEHTARAMAGCFMNFNGTAGLLRKSAIEDAGNWQGDTLTEDLDLSYRMQLKGYRIVYLPFVECMSELPENITSLKNQQSRWTQGSIQVAKKLLALVLKSSLPLRIKLEAFAHLCAPVTYLAALLLSILIPLILITQSPYRSIFKTEEFMLYIVFIMSLSTYYLYAQIELTSDWKKSIQTLPFIFFMGVVLCVGNSWAILKALWGNKGEFLRTPKYDLRKRLRAYQKKERYSPRLNQVLLGVEILFAIWLNMSIYFMITSQDWPITPFYTILLFGFNYNLYLSFSYR